MRPADPRARRTGKGKWATRRGQHGVYDKIIQPSTIIGARASELALAASGDAVRPFRPHMKRKYTEKQGQYLAFVHYYTKIHGYPPAEADMQRYF